MSIWKFDKILPRISSDHQLTRGEGNTPLVRSSVIGRRLGVKNLFFKLENLNPTGSYKDRFAAVAVSDLAARSQRVCVSTSSGNTGAALAAYCAASQIRCIILAVDGAPIDKLMQMQVYGAEVIEVENFGLNAAVTTMVFEQLEAFARRRGVAVPISAYRYASEAMAGVETMAWEILQQVHPAHIFSPAGGGGLTLAVARGCKKYRQHHAAIHCVQPEGNDTIASALRNNLQEASQLERSTTSISGLQVPGVLDGNEVIAACRETGGTGFTVTDNQILACQAELCSSEGIFCEPAGAVALAGLEQAVKQCIVRQGEDVVCLVTGTGFKNIATARGIARSNPLRRHHVDDMGRLLLDM